MLITVNQPFSTWDSPPPSTGSSIAGIFEMNVEICRPKAAVAEARTPRMRLHETEARTLRMPPGMMTPVSS